MNGDPTTVRVYRSLLRLYPRKLATSTPGYRASKIGTVLDTISDFSGVETGDHVLGYHWPRWHQRPAGHGEHGVEQLSSARHVHRIIREVTHHRRR